MQTDVMPDAGGPALPVRKIVDAIDMINGFFGKAASILVIPMVYCLLHEVAGRYFFTAPTIWAGDLAVIMYGIMFMVASPYCLRDGVHIRTDFLYNRWSDRTKGIVDFFIYLLAYLPVHIIFLKIGWDYFFRSFQLGERIISSPWMPIIWPLKFAIPLGILLMVLQGIAETVKSFYAMKYGKFFWDMHRHTEGVNAEGPEACIAK